MIKVNSLVKLWEVCGYDYEAKENEYKRLRYAMWTLYENGVINKETFESEYKKLDLAFEKATR